MKVPRKLFRHDLLVELARKAAEGVPISRLIRDYNLDCSLPHLRKHVDYYIMFNNKPEVHASLFPPWLNATDDLQEENGEYKYEGLFPWGEWIPMAEWVLRR